MILLKFKDPTCFEAQVVEDTNRLDFQRKEAVEYPGEGMTAMRHGVADMFLDWMYELQNRNWAQRHLGQVRGYVKELDDYIKRGNSFVGEIG